MDVPISCLLVDDEAPARRLLADYVRKIPDLQLLGECASAMEAGTALRSNEAKGAPVSLLFLDIHLPDLSGLDFLKSLKNRPKVVMITAFPNYALQGFELDVTDYLLKPVAFERFYQAVQKVLNLQTHPSPAPSIITPAPTSNHDFLFVKSDSKILKINYSEIIYIEGMREYVRIHLGKEKLMPLLSLQKLEESLPADRFIRIHRSYIVQLAHIQSVQGNMVEIGGTLLPISKGYRDAFYQKLEENGLF